MATNVKSDISFSSGGTVYRFNLGYDTEGLLMWKLNAPRQLPQAFVTEAPTYDNIPPDKRLYRDQYSYSGGFGQEWFVAKNKYYSSTGADSSLEDRIYLPPLMNPVNGARYQPLPTITNGGFETSATTVTGWTESGGWTITTDSPNEGTNSALLFNNTANPLGGTIYQAIASQTSDELVFTANFRWTKLAGHTIVATLSFDDGFSATSATHTDSSADVAGTVNLSVKRVCLTSNGTISVIVTAPPTASSVLVDSVKVAGANEFEEHGGTLYASRGARLEYFAGGATWTLANTFAHEITSLRSYGANLYLGSEYGYYYLTGGTATPQTVTASTASKFGLWGTYLARCDITNREVTLSVNGTVWTSACTISSGAGSITELIDHPTLRYAMRENRMFQISTDTTPIVTEVFYNLRQSNDSLTGRNAKLWHEELYIPAGENNLFRVTTDGEISDIHPTNFITGDISYAKKCVAIDGDSRFLTAILCSQTAGTYVLAHHFRGKPNSSGEWIWHEVNRWYTPGVNDFIVYNDGTTIHSFLAEQNTIRRISHPGNYNDLENDPYYEFALQSGGTLWFSKHDAGFRDQMKAFHSVTFMTSNCDANKKWVAYYELDSSGGTPVAFGTITSSPQTVVQLSGTVTGRWMRIGVAGSTNANASSPVILGYRLSGQVRTTRRYEWEIGIRVSSMQILPASGSATKVKTATAIASLKTLLNLAQPIVYTDIDGQTYYVTIEETPMKMTYEAPTRKEQGERLVVVKLQEAEFS